MKRSKRILKNQVMSILVVRWHIDDKSLDNIKNDKYKFWKLMCDPSRIHIYWWYTNHKEDYESPVKRLKQKTRTPMKSIHERLVLGHDYHGLGY